jgi:hypothetical protein
MPNVSTSAYVTVIVVSLTISSIANNTPNFSNFDINDGDKHFNCYARKGQATSSSNNWMYTVERSSAFHPK